MEGSRIGWLNGGNTFNPWIGCKAVSAGCSNCYARGENARRLWCADFLHDRHRMSEAYWRSPLEWDRASAMARPTLVFSGSLCDVYERRDDLKEPRRRLQQLIRATPHLLWLLLTKRPENILALNPVAWLEDAPPNVWYGTTVEHGETEGRADDLMAVPAAGRFVSCEPMLGPVDLGRMTRLGRLDWVICGGERGRNARPIDLGWAERLRAQCGAAGVPFFFKQLGDRFDFSVFDGEEAEAMLGHRRFPAAFGI